ncbi:MAG: hypothetical protein M3228_10425 [Actinomycetota bacterium]|nr:hypothetical protein [Actinomycetota bacterium]
MRGQLDKMHADVSAMQKQWDVERAALSDALDNERRQVARLAADLARYRADLAVADARIAELTSSAARHGRRSME